MRQMLLACITPALLAACDGAKTSDGGKTGLVCTRAPTFWYCSNDFGCSRDNDSFAGSTDSYVIDYSAKTVDGHPAKISESAITWEANDKNGHYSYAVDRYTKHLVTVFTTENTRSTFEAQCEAAQKAF